MPVILLTDALFFLLLVTIITYIFYARRHEHLCAPWRHVAKRPLALIAGILLGFYLIIGLADSIHFYPRAEHDGANKESYETKIYSLLDVVLLDLKQNTERTYSSPLASHSFVKEIIEREDGRKIRDYPRLQYGASHLKDPAAERHLDIIKRIFIGLAYGIIWSLIFALLLIIYLARTEQYALKKTFYRCVRNQFFIPWYVVLLTVTAMIITSSIVYHLASYYHVFGTDKVGNDVLYQSLKSIRTGLMIGTLTTLVMLPFAMAMGVMAGYFGGWIDDLIQYLYTTLNSIPGVLLIAASILLVQVYISNHEADFANLAQRADLRLFCLCAILGITSWTGLCRLLRAETLKLRELDYVQAAKAFGVSHYSIMLRHLLPNLMHIIIISIVLDFSGLVLAEAVLSYINIGVDPSTHSWGNMINSARLEMAREPIVWWSLAAAFIFMFVLVLAANLFSDAVRDAFDPRLSGSY